MADFDHTLEFSSAQEKPSYTTNLIVQNVCASTPSGIGSLAHSVISGQYNPYIVLQGKWLREFGFEVGDRIRVLAESDLLQVMPGFRFSEANTKVKVGVGGAISHVDFKEEVDGIKAEKGCIVDTTGSGKESDTDVGQSGDKDVGMDLRKDTDNKNYTHTAKSEDVSDVLTGVKSGLDYV